LELSVINLSREVIITVMGEGSACPAGKSRVMSSSPSNLIAAGVKKETSVNEAPDWGLIIGRYTTKRNILISFIYSGFLYFVTSFVVIDILCYFY